MDGSSSYPITHVAVLMWATSPLGTTISPNLFRKSLCMPYSTTISSLVLMTAKSHPASRDNGFPSLMEEKVNFGAFLVIQVICYAGSVWFPISIVNFFPTRGTLWLSSRSYNKASKRPLQNRLSMVSSLGLVVIGDSQEVRQRPAYCTGFYPVPPEDSRFLLMGYRHPVLPALSRSTQIVRGIFFLHTSI